ncbi:MAG: hypothetical protein AAF471_02845 [Myxococcota bacterium]
MAQANTSNPLRLAVGFALALCTQFGLAQSAQAMGQIGYFEDECPEGWEPYQGLTGRVVVGAGNYIREDDEKEAKIYRSGATGGEMRHTLTVQEMPQHHHTTGITGLYNSYGGGQFARGTDWGGGEHKIYHNANTSSAGGDQSHNNMPPYLVLAACRKVTDDVEPLRREMREQRERLEALENAARQGD